MGPVLSLASFVGAYTLARRIPTAAVHFDHIPEGTPFGRYKIHSVCTCGTKPRPEWNDARRKRHRQRNRRAGAPGTAATLDGLIVGTSRFRHLWVHPEHRGRGLGTELLVRRYLASSEMQFEGRPGHALSLKGARAYERAYHRLVELGAIVNPELSSARSD